ncbi:unnamed protein product [Notodromas monacha]|uniref:B-block binding subunit of TFIIIC domain-containing protein n=1 Tax=Notodromas monacha TaxID=399045 RepID=A0A7R9BS63_9CRUS|nr:unnamed protein product [Notodromas monacha]CAG0919325.1 unnamed protein product [Notodromas monacha]
MDGDHAELTLDSVDYAGCICDEISLEGLDGITIEGLWKRLAARKPKFGITIDHSSKKFLWNIIKRMNSISFFLLEKPRKELIVYDRFDPSALDSETGMLKEEDDLNDLYPFEVIDDADIRGSCASYHTRRPAPCLHSSSLDEAMSKYGNRLVIVASQRARNIALAGNHPIPIKLSAIQYAMMERIGRGRYSGEITQGKSGLLQKMNINPKTMFHLRKLLLKNNLVVKQDCSMKSKATNVLGRLLQLKRFYSQFLAKAEKFVHAAADLLKTKPQKKRVLRLLSMPYADLLTQLGYTPGAVKKMIKTNSFKKAFRLSTPLYREVYPDADKKEFMRKSQAAERQVKIIEMICDPSAAQDEPEEEDDDDDDDDNGQLLGYLDKSDFAPNRHVDDVVMLYIESQGSDGVSITDVTAKVGLNKLDTRSIFRKLVKKGDLVAVSVLRGRQKTIKYVSKYLDGLGIEEREGEVKQHLEELNALRELIEKHKLEIRDMQSALESSKTQHTNLRKSNVDYDVDPMSEGILNIRIKNIEEQFDIVLERSDDQSSNSKSPKSKGGDDKKSLLSSDMTFTNLRRSRRILEYIQQRKLVPVYYIQKWLRSEELQEGLEQLVDRKSILTLLRKMEHEGLVRCIKTTYEWLSNSRDCLLIAHSGFPTDAISIEDKLNTDDLTLIRGGDSFVTIPEGLTEFWNTKNLIKDVRISELHKDEAQANDTPRGPGKMFTGSVPKFQRQFLFHQMAFYITRGYDGDPNLDQKRAWAAVNEEICLHHGPHFALSEDEIRALPRLYRSEISWNMFIPPLRLHPAWLTQDGESVPDGWFMLCEFIYRLPMNRCIFLLKARKPLYASDYFDHPVKKFIPVLFAEDIIRNHLLQGRYNIAQLVECASLAVMMGLLLPGKRLTKHSETMFFYVNTNITLTDTRLAKECYNQIHQTEGLARRSFNLTNLEALNQMWQVLHLFCVGTKMGSYNARDDESGSVLRFQKSTSGAETWKPVDFLEAANRDNGSIPGNGKGAAGFDSMLFSHRLPSWFTTDEKEKVVEDCTVMFIGSCHDIEGLDMEEEALEAVAPQNLQRRGRKRLGDMKNFASERKRSRLNARKGLAIVALDQDDSDEDHASPRTSVRVRSFGGKNSVIGFEDDMDRKTKERNIRLRAKWSREESEIMTMCRAAIIFTTQKLSKRVSDKCLNAVTIRDLLHIYLPDPFPTSDDSDETAASAVDRSLKPLVELLRKEFSAKRKLPAALNEIFSTLPSSLEDLNKMFIVRDLSANESDLSTWRIQSVDDVQATVISGILMSSMCCRGDKNSWGMQLFKAFSEFSLDLLRRVVKKFQLAKISARVKSKQRLGRILSLKQLPTAASSYRLSTRFNDKIKCGGFRYETFAEIDDALITLLRSVGVEARGLEVTSFNHGGLTCVIMSFTSSGQLSMIAELPLKDMLTFTRPDLKIDRQDEEDDDPDLLSFDPLRGITSKNHSSPKPGLIVESSPSKSIQRRVSHRQRYQAGKSDPETPALEECRSKAVVKVQTSKLFLKLNCVPAEVDIDLECPRNNYDLFLPHAARQSVLKHHQSYIERVEKITLDDLITSSKRENISDEDCDCMRTVFNYIEEAGTLGLTINEMKKKLKYEILPGDRLRLGEMLRMLVAAQLIWAVGSRDIVYVAESHVKPWLVRGLRFTRKTRENCMSAIEKFKSMASAAKSAENDEVSQGASGVLAAATNLESIASEVEKGSQKIHFQIFPWIHIDGSQNRRVLDRLLGAVLGHLLAQPGQSARNIANYYEPYLSSRTTFELLKMLDSLGCVQTIVMSPENSNSTVFDDIDAGKWVLDSIVEDSDVADVVYEPTIDAVIKFAAFVSVKEVESIYARKKTQTRRGMSVKEGQLHPEQAVHPPGGSSSSFRLVV